MAILMAVLLPRVTSVIRYVTARIQSCAHIRETPWALKSRQENTVCQLQICQLVCACMSLWRTSSRLVTLCCSARMWRVCWPEAPSPSSSALRGHKRAPSGLSCVCGVVLYNIAGGGGGRIPFWQPGSMCAWNAIWVFYCPTKTHIYRHCD